MTSIRPRTSTSVRRLARQLSLRALLGLGSLCALGAGALAAAVALLDAALAGGGGVRVFALLLAAAPCLWLAACALRWLAAPPPPADGVPLRREQAPGLYRLVDRLNGRMAAPPVDTIRISPEINAAVHQRPRFAFIGPMRTTLVIGLPLVHSVSPRQLCAILAHEMAHLARQRRGADAWGAHLRAWWHRACERVAGDGALPALPVQLALARWAEADVLEALRLNHLEEYEADRVAARLVGAQLLGDTLVEVAMKAEFLETDYWDKVMAQADHRPRPVFRPFRDMGMGVAAGFHALPHAGLLLSVLCDEDRCALHPTLTDRLAALRVAPSVPPPAARTAANHYLRPALAGLSRRFDHLWWRTARGAWRRHYQRCRCPRSESVRSA